MRVLDVNPTDRKYHIGFGSYCIEYVSCEPPDGLEELFPEGYGVVDDDSFEKEEMEQA